MAQLNGRTRGRPKQLIAKAEFDACTITLKSIPPFDRVKHGGIASVERVWTTGETTQFYPMYSFSDAFDLFNSLCLQEAPTCR